ncbi:MAG: LytTR family DNA-binding domain-containing protein [Bacteroidota bacterium]
MKDYKAIIIDDEAKIRKVLEIKLGKHCEGVEVVATAANITEAYQLIQKHQPDLIFLDISMPGGSGFDLLSRFEKINFEIIFVTGFDDYALDALKVSAVDYLLKPIITENLIKAVEKAKERIEDRNKIEKYHNLQHNLENIGNQSTKLVIPGLNSYGFVKVCDIIRCEGWEKYTKLYLNDGNCLVSSHNLGVFRDMLKSYDFYHTHKSHLINTKLISRYLKDGFVIMIDGSEVPVARRKREEFLREVVRKK